MSASMPVTEGLFAVGADGAAHLVGGRCAACARPHFPAAPWCPYCGADGCTPCALGRRGRLWLYTAVLNRPPGYLGEVPFGFGIVELPEGLRVIARLTEAAPERLAPGMPVELAIVPLHVDADGRAVLTYAFAPAAEAGP